MFLPVLLKEEKQLTKQKMKAKGPNLCLVIYLTGLSTLQQRDRAVQKCNFKSDMKNEPKEGWDIKKK